MVLIVSTLIEPNNRQGARLTVPPTLLATADAVIE
jgi:hypothetical protein